MEHAGGACTAYTVKLNADGTLWARTGTALRNGESLTVARNDMVKLRQSFVAGNPPTVAA